MPAVAGLSGEALTIDHTVMPPKLMLGTVVYDPRVATSLVGGAKLSDAEFAEIEAAVGRAGIAEVLVLLGYYTSVALGMKVHEVPIPPQP